MFFCDRAGCIRGKQGFVRKDYLRRHQRIHKAADKVPAPGYHEMHGGDDRAHYWTGALELGKEVVGNDQSLVNAFKLF
jgi:hypothetical protein